MYKIVADSSCDLLDLQYHNLNVVPLTISTAERDFIDDSSLNCHEMLTYLAGYRGKSYTACPSSESWLQAFEQSHEIYVVTMTSALSGTYNSACLAAKLYQEQHPDAYIHVFDSLSTGSEMQLIIEKIIELKEAHITKEDLVSEVQKYQKHTRLFFSFQSLHNLAQNGRINKVIASTIGALGISIIGTASEEGVIKPINKSRGEKKLLSKFVSEIQAAGYRGKKLRIDHVENMSLAQKLSDKIIALFPNADISITPARGLCSYYGERGGLILACEV